MSVASFESNLDRYQMKKKELLRTYVMPDMVHGSGYVVWVRANFDFPVAVKECVTKMSANRFVNTVCDARLDDKWRDMSHDEWLAKAPK